MVRRFEMIEGGTSKFWEISIDGARHTVTFGRIGTAGQSKAKPFPSAEAASKDAEALIRSKVAKGYVEVGGGSAQVSDPETPEPPQNANASGTLPPAQAEPAAVPIRKLRRAKADCGKGSIDFNQCAAMPKGRFIALFRSQRTDATITASIWNAWGKVIATFELPKPLAAKGRTASGDLLFVHQEQLIRVDREGKETVENIPGIRRATILSDETAVLNYDADDLKLRRPDGTLISIAKNAEQGFYWPVALADDGFALVAKEEPRRLLVFDRTGKQRVDQRLDGKGCTLPTQAPDGRVVVASGTTLHLIGPGENHVEVNLGEHYCCRPLPLPNGWVAIATVDGTVGFYSPWKTTKFILSGYEWHGSEHAQSCVTG